MFSSPLSFFLRTFPLARVVAQSLRAAVGGDGGGSGATAAPVAVTQVTSSTPSIPQLVAGATRDLIRDTIPFNVTTTATVATGHASGTIPFLTHAHIKPLYNGRASAELVGERVYVSIIPELAANATLVHISGSVAIRGHRSGATYFSKPDEVARYPGATAMTLTAGISTMAVLDMTPGIHTNAILSPLMGVRPLVVFAFNSVGVAKITVVVSGQLHLSGIGETSF